MKVFNGKVALITGAGNGFGKEFAVEAAKRGMKLYLVDIDESDLKRTAEKVRSMGTQVDICVADVSVEDDVERMVNGCMETYDRIDLLINNAGVVTPGTVEELPSRDWEWIIGVNNLSQVYAMKRVIPIMRKQGTECHILNVASLAGLVTMGYMPAYYATKHFAVAVTESVYYDLMKSAANIKMSVFCPSYVQTDLHNCERHRPARFFDKNDPYYGSDRHKWNIGQAAYEITHGTPLEPIGPFVFDNLSKDNFYIQSHPAAKPMIKHRNHDIEKERQLDLEFIKDMDDLAHGKKSIAAMLRVMKKI